MTEIVDEFPEMDKPFTRYSVVVAYPPERSGIYAGKTVRLRGAEPNLALAEKRREWHLNNGALWAVVEGQTWAPSSWDQVQ